MFTAEDVKQLSARGIGMDTVERQMEYFRKGFPFLQLDRPATVNDGILQLSAGETDRLQGLYETKLGRRKIFKFVPASGAATRMFKELYEFVQWDGGNGKTSATLDEVFNRLDDFAFCHELKHIMAAQHIAPSDRKGIAVAILQPGGLNYGNLPKGMLLFHKYDHDVRTALEEHLVEGAVYAANIDRTVNLHFTVSPEHLQGFEALAACKAEQYADMFGVRYHISFSQQKPSTDVLAVDRDNYPVRNADGSILFRPGGHGALLENLNDVDADMIFIKNIDNVVPDRLKPATVKYKKALAGLLIELQKVASGYARLLRSDDGSAGAVAQALDFLADRLSFRPPAAIASWPAGKVRTYLLDVLHRPVRVCGMVKNEGEPGGGPFWVRHADGSVSLQIAESSQINMADPRQKEMADNATHFNPVDLVCAVKDDEGHHYNLLQYRDPDTGFISMKSKDGVELKAQELPGLWNGAMAHWNTAFVEVPVETFNPVKTINDLLRSQHQ